MTVPAHGELVAETTAILRRLGVPDLPADGDLIARSPITGGELARIRSHTAEDVSAIVGRAHDAFAQWRSVPAPARGALVRELGQALRAAKADLGRLVSIEAGKIRSEGLGEVQEMIDICDLAVGLSRQLFGQTIASERPGHRMMEQWHPLGVVGVISAFNFPVAVWSWNSALAFVCGDAVVWKPSEKTPLTAIACHALFEKALREFDKTHPGVAPEGLSQLLLGARDVGQVLTESPKVPLVSATGSVRMGMEVAQVLAKRLGRSILELGGNNAMIVAPSADLDLVVRGVTFSAVGTAGQRCTTLRRLIVHTSVVDQLLPRLEKAFGSVKVGSPLDSDTLVGPLVDRAAFDGMQKALRDAREQGGDVKGGERVDVGGHADAYYVRPAFVRMPAQTAVVERETFAPILYVLTYDNFADALQLQNGVPQGLSSAIFTNDIREAEQFMSAAGSDCGIVNV